MALHCYSFCDCPETKQRAGFRLCREHLQFVHASWTNGPNCRHVSRLFDAELCLVHRTLILVCGIRAQLVPVGLYSLQAAQLSRSRNVKKVVVLSQEQQYQRLLILSSRVCEVVIRIRILRFLIRHVEHIQNFFQYILK
jgi:hypothetical protein